jgi:hypothetical protein
VETPLLATLTPHPDFGSDAVNSIEVEVVRGGEGALALTYVVTGDIAALALPPPAPQARTDGLWRHTCLEAFVQPDDGEGYFEFNLAPSTQWAAYAFAGYRDGMASADVLAPRIAVETTSTALRLHATLHGLPPSPCRLALAAVIEETTGRKSYWALAHAPGRPDFHHAAGFTLPLPSSPSWGGTADA